ncbi:hypothetical protein Hanom_Chr09g00762841 [Helianthus anomalus]
MQPPKSFHDWKHKFFFIKVGVIPMKIVFRGKEDVATETIQTPYSENWYQDLKDFPLIALPEKALVSAAMSLCWRMNREDKPVYMEGDKVISLYVVAFEREGGTMATIPKKALKRKKSASVATVAPKRSDVEKNQSAKAKNVGGEKKGMRHSSDSWSDYMVVSNLLQGLAPAVVRKPKPEPRDTADIPPSNPDDPIDLEPSPEHLLRKKAGKRKQTDAEAEGQPAKKVQRKKITRRGNLDCFTANPLLGKCSSLFTFMHIGYL